MKLHVVVVYFYENPLVYYILLEFDIDSRDGRSVTGRKKNDTE